MPAGDVEHGRLDECNVTFAVTQQFKRVSQLRGIHQMNARKRLLPLDGRNGIQYFATKV